MEMIERVARAIFAAEFETETTDYDWVHCPPRNKELYYKRAKAAIQAMRDDPTPEMMSAFARTNGLKKAYKAMIDAALSGKSGMGEGRERVIYSSFLREMVG